MIALFVSIALAGQVWIGGANTALDPVVIVSEGIPAGVYLNSVHGHAVDYSRMDIITDPVNGRILTTLTPIEPLYTDEWYEAGSDGLSMLFLVDAVGNTIDRKIQQQDTGYSDDTVSGSDGPSKGCKELAPKMMLVPALCLFWRRKES